MSGNIRSRFLAIFCKTETICTGGLTTRRAPLQGFSCASIQCCAERQKETLLGQGNAAGETLLGPSKVNPWIFQLRWYCCSKLKGTFRQSGDMHRNAIGPNGAEDDRLGQASP